MRALRLLYPPEPGQRQVQSPHGLLIRFQAGPGADRNRIELIELQEGDILRQATPLDVTELPKLY